MNEEHNQNRKIDLMEMIIKARKELGMRSVVRAFVKSQVEMGTGDKLRDFLQNLQEGPVRIFK